MYFLARAAGGGLAACNSSRTRPILGGYLRLLGYKYQYWGTVNYSRSGFCSPARPGRIRINNTPICVCPRTRGAAMDLLLFTTRSTTRNVHAAQRHASHPPSRGSRKKTNQVMQPTPKTGTITETRHDESEAQNHLDLSDPTVYPCTPSGKGLTLHPVAAQPDWLLIVYRCTRPYTLAASSSLAWR